VAEQNMMDAFVDLLEEVSEILLVPLPISVLLAQGEDIDSCSLLTTESSGRIWNVSDTVTKSLVVSRSQK
jgi:hypothetical protein